MYLSQCSLLVLFSVTILFQVAFSTKKGGVNAPNAPPQPTGLHQMLSSHQLFN